MLPANPTRRQVIAAGIAGIVGTAMAGGQEKSVKEKPKQRIAIAPDAVTGPMVGHTGDRWAYLWVRPARPGKVALSVSAAGGGPVQRFESEAAADNDLCVSVRVGGLEPGIEYAYRFEQDGAELGSGRFSTWSAPSQPAKVTLAFGSCARNEASPVWSRMKESGAQAIVLMGDTPYIDSYDLGTVRRKHREFLHVPELKELIEHMPVWGTWDDHDFGLNAHLGNSNPKGKAFTRKGFVEYRALAHHGEDGQGVYTSFRAGPLEVWLLDPRWFAMTEDSPVAPGRPTCFGAAQWTWLLRTLKASTATFKLLAMGEVWQDKENKEADDMGTFPYEREALVEFIRKERIGGVMLLGGDIHVSRHLCSKGAAGYDLHEFVSSPIHDSVIPTLNVPHPDLVWGHPEPMTFLKVVADNTVLPARFVATFLNATGKVLHEVQLTDRDLT